MNYKVSNDILNEVKKAKSILINCHREPDPDSIGSALALRRVLKKLGKKISVVCASELPDNLRFLEGFELIRKNVDFSKFDFSRYDLFITLDSSSWNMVSGNKETPQPSIKMIVIDHHKTNTNYGMINLVDSSISSTAELLFKVIEDWKIEFDLQLATLLMAGIIGDTGAFRYPRVNSNTFEVALKLMKCGADKDKIIFNIYNRSSIKLLKFWGEALSRMEIDIKHGFVWTAVPYEIFIKHGGFAWARESTASNFGSIVEGSNFGIIMVENEKNQSLAISFRSRTGFDTSNIAKELGGGGHVYASGASVKGLPFSKAVEVVLKVSRKYAKKLKNSS